MHTSANITRRAGWPRTLTASSANSSIASSSSLAPNSSAATGRSRSRKISHAFRTAAPFRSAPLDAAVGEVFGTLSVLVAISRIFAAGNPSSRIATPSIFTLSPCPISVPPWFTCTEPSG